MRFAKLLLPTLLALAATTTPPLTQAQPKPFELNMDRVKVAGSGGFAGKTIYLTGYTLYVSATGDVWAQNKGGFFSNAPKAQAHGKFYVKGLDKAMLQGLAQKLTDDLASRLRDAGFTVLTYDDMKDQPVIASHERLKAEPNWGLPVKGNTWTSDPLTYVIATPTDAQAMERPITGPLFWMNSLAREKQIVMVAPEITLSVPQMYGEASEGYKRAEAGISTNPAMKLLGAFVWSQNGNGGGTNIQVLEHGKRLVVDNTGTMKKLSDDTTTFSSVWKRSSADFMFELDQAAFSDGVLRVGHAINAVVLDQAVKANK